jgi:hypothetical protein
MIDQFHRFVHGNINCPCPHDIQELLNADTRPGTIDNIKASEESAIVDS